jgi:formylglycine-generating enzyme required for sulfatase activity
LTGSGSPHPASVLSGPAALVRPPLAVAPFNEKIAKQYQVRWAKVLGVPVVQNNSIGIKLVLIPPGEFMMGSPQDLIQEEWRMHGDNQPRDAPQHRVRISKPYDKDYYAKSPADDPAGPASGSLRVRRGGSWNAPANFCRSAYRDGIAPDGRVSGLGFRVALILPEK